MKTNLLSLKAALALLFVVLSAQGAKAGEVQTVLGNGIVSGFTATSGTGGSNPGEEYPHLVDGDTGKKFFSGSNDVFVEFHSSVAFIPTGYILTTGNL